MHFTVDKDYLKINSSEFGLTTKLEIKISFRPQLISTKIHLEAKPETGSLNTKSADETKSGGVANTRNS